MANTLTLPRPLNMSDLDSLQTATDSFGRAIAFIDTAVPDYQMLANGVIPGIEVVLLDPHSAIKQITLALKNRTFSAVHIISHGVPGGLQLGYLDFSWENLHRNLYLAVAVKQWGASLTPNAEILLYGCNVAARRRGIAFVERLNLLTGAKIAASARPTGSAAKGGDWELEVTTGEMRVPKAFKPEVMATYSHILTGFGAANNFPVSSSPIGEIAEDFNGDGLVDLAVLQNGTQASLLLGNGNGTFGPATPVGTGTFGSHVDFVAKDFNGDGQLDLAVGKQNGGGEFPSSSISIVLGTNAGQFAPPSTINLQLSSLAAIETADFNNDGNADLAATNSFGNNVQILLGTGQGTFGNATEFDVGDNPAAIAVGDLNNDGNQDLAITDLSAHNVSVLLGDGTGGFGSATEFFGGGTSPNAVAIGDVDGDNNLDLVVAYTDSNNISVLLGTGTGKFDAPIFFNTGQAPDDLILADFDADNNLDVATANSGSNNISLLLGTGTGSFGTATSLAVGANPRAILASDLNGDNRLDLVAANSGASNLSVLLNNVVNFGAATFSGVEGSTDTIVTIPVSLAALPANNVTVAIGIDPSSTATNSTDYSLSTTSLTFTPNATALTQNIEVTIKADNLPENAETVVLKLGDIIGASAGDTNQATLTIEPNGTLSYAVTAGIDTIKEGDAGSKPLTFTVARSGDTGASSSVDYAIAGTATDGSDYNNIGGTSGAAGLTGTINFAAGETSKTVTLDVLGDTVVEADETVSVTLSNPTGPATTPTISSPTATTTILNDDVIGVNIAPASTTATEGGTTGSYNLSLKSQPTDVVTINFDPGTQLKPIDPLKFTPTDWNIPQTITVGAIDDANAEGPHTATITHSLVSNDPNYNGLAIAGVDVAIGDNDKPGLSIAPSSLKVGEGGPTANLTVSLNTQPKDPVTVKLGTTDNQLEPLGSVTFDNTNWNTPQSVTVKAVDDVVVEGDHASTIIFTTSSADTEYNALVIPPTSVAIADNDSTPTPTPTPTPTFTPTPTPIPTPTPTFTPTPTPQLFIPPGSFLPLNPTPTPTPTPTTNPFLPPIPPFIITPPAIPAGITVSPTSNLTTTEAGGTAQFTVKLNTKPTANVKIDLGSSDTSEGIISPVSLSFTPDNWNQPQTVKVEGVNDLLPDGNQNYTIITSPAISTDPKYAGLNASDVSVTNLDNEPGGFTILPPNLNRSNVPYKAGELLVKLKPGSNNEAIQSAFQVNGALAIENLIPPTEQANAKPRRLDRWRIVKFASDADLLEIKRLLAQDPRIEAVQLNYEESINAVPNDTDFGSLWGLNNTGASGGTPDADIDAPEAWDIETGDSNVIVAVIDSGVDYNHQDLAANMWVNTGEIAGNGIDDDGNGYVDDRQGYDFVNNDNNPMDDNSHGSHVAGTVGAVGNNNLGVVGVNQTVKLMPLKFLGAGGTGSVANAAQAIRYATDKGADVINYSAGGYRPPDFDPTSDVRYDAIADAGDAGVLFVAAAGNDTNNNDTNAFYPAGFNLPNVVSVAATTRNDGLASYSNFGSTTVDLGAPGSTILSTLPGNLYGNKSGTSMASPHVAGAAALLLAQNPGRTPAQLKDILMTTVDPLPALAGTTVSGGRLNLRDALNRTPIVNKSVFGQSQAGGFSQAGNTFVMVANSYTDPDPSDSISYSIALADKNAIDASDFTTAFGLDGKSYRKPNSNSFPSIPLPGWLTFNAATRTININPATRPTTFDYWMKVTGTDVSGASVSEIIRFKSYALGGFVIDGYISGASVFLDVNKNGRLDANEPTTTSDANGQFSLDADFSGFDKNENGEIDSEEGNIVAIGGTDTATGLPLETPVTAPPDATVVTLLTTLVADLIDRGVDPDTAESQVKAALSLPANIELISLDPIAATENNVPGGVEVFSAMVKAQNFITQTASLIDGASSADRTDIVKAVTGAIASQIQGGASLNLSDADQLNSAIQQAIAKTQQIDPALNIQQLLSITPLAATVMAEANQRIDAVVSATPSGSVGREVARVQKVSLGETTQDFLAVGAGSKSIQDAIAENTGAALTAQIQAAVLPTGAGGAVLGGETEVTTTASDGLSGTESDDILTGGSSNDVITGKRGNDNLSGLEGNDWIHGNQGNDSLDGGAGDDSLYGGKGNDNLLGGDGQDVLFGNRAQDTLIGGEGGDSLYGGKGFDTLLGGGGDDFLSGDLGEDALIGGTGNDRFALTPGTGTDSIVDFEVGQDSLVLGNGVTFAQLAITQADNATLIQFVPTGQILVSLQGVSANQIGPSNFSFL